VVRLAIQKVGGVWPQGGPEAATDDGMRLASAIEFVRSFEAGDQNTRSLVIYNY
jgi:hypothetical protein